jgi:hypothetical protein
MEWPDADHVSVEFDHHLIGMFNTNPDFRDPKAKIMNRSTEHPALVAERERAQRAQYAALTAHYGEIGSAALLAALICAQQKRDTDVVSKAA